MGRFAGVPGGCPPGTVHAAAKKVKLDHSTVGRRIEDLLATKLLDHSQGGVVVRGCVQQLLDPREEPQRASYHAAPHFFRARI